MIAWGFHVQCYPCEPVYQVLYPVQDLFGSTFAIDNLSYDYYLIKRAVVVAHTMITPAGQQVNFLPGMSRHESRITGLSHISWKRVAVIVVFQAISPNRWCHFRVTDCSGKIESVLGLRKPQVHN